MKHCTTIEQSKKLLELGISRDTADMVYSHKTIFYNMMEHRLFVDEDDNWHLHQRSEIAFMDTGNEIPCWSLSTLLEVMPYINDRISNCKPILNKNFFKGISYQCRYIRESVPDCAIASFISSTPIEAAYSMVVWLLENGYIKKESNQ